MRKLAITSLRTPVGTLYLGADGEGLRFSQFDAPPEDAQFRTCNNEEQSRATELLRAAKSAFRQYFSGDFASLARIKVAPNGTAFQRAVWHTLQQIPLGKTLSYSEVATKSGAPNAARAAGSACGKNPLVVIVPCHRVVPADRSLGNFSAGVERKQFLLSLEGASVRP